MARVQGRLKAVQAELDRIKIASGTPISSLVTECTTSSGDLFQPRALRTWRPVDDANETAVDDLAAALAERGWEVRHPADELGPEATFESNEGWRATASIGQTEAIEPDPDQLVPDRPSEAYVEVTIDDATPCMFG